MPGSPSDAVRDLAARLVSLSEADFVPAFNAGLRELFAGFYIDSAAIRDSAGTQTPIFETVVSVRPIEGGIAEADAVACAACVYSVLDAAKLRDACNRVALAKSLRKAPPSRQRQSTVTLGLVVAAQSSQPLPQLADILKTLSRTAADSLRPDMIAVLSRGVISYAVRFAADRGIGDLLPPQQGAAQYVPAILVYLITVATTSYALNRMVGYLIGQVVFFAPQLPRPDMSAIIEGVPQQRNIIATYQMNLAGAYVEIGEPAELLKSPYWIESPEGELLLKMFYQPWQDGGVIVAEGLAPLEGMLILAQKPLSLFSVKQPGNKQVSAVLPLSVDEFHALAKSIASRSNFIVRPGPQQFTIANMMNEGTSTPFVARLFMTPLNMRDHVLDHDKAKIDEFDIIFGSTLNDLVTLRRIGKETVDLWNGHQAQVTSGQIARNQGIHIYVDETIDETMLHSVETIIKNAASSAKLFQNLTKIFGVDIGFMYKREAGYKAGLQALEQTDSALASYLAEVRKWLEPLILLRDELEHKPIMANRITYNRDAQGNIRANEPHVMGMPVTTFIPILLSRLIRFVEEVLMWGFQRASPFRIGEIPIGQRNLTKPERFKFVYNVDEQVWIIIYSDDDFDRV